MTYFTWEETVIGFLPAVLISCVVLVSVTWSIIQDCIHYTGRQRHQSRVHQSNSELNNDVINQSAVECIFCDGDGVTWPPSAEFSLKINRRTFPNVDKHLYDTQHRSLLDRKSKAHNISLHLNYPYRRSPRSYDVTAASSRRVHGISRDYRRNLNMANDDGYSEYLQRRDVMGHESSRMGKPMASSPVLDQFMEAIRAEQRASQELTAIRSVANVRRT